jgi:hypothetical protein
VVKPLTPEFFYKSIPQFAGFDYRCKICERERAKWRNMLRLYGLTKVNYEAMLVAQGNACAVCKEPAGKRLLDIDHDHLTGQNRGLLCRRCNLMLGYAYEDPELLRALADYLEEHIRP